jgi:hypothetical protein
MVEISPELRENTEKFNANIWKAYNSYAGEHPADCHRL